MTRARRTVAVVVTWNRRELLLSALAAVHAQQPEPAAVVVVDNGSTDGTAEAVRALADTHPAGTHPADTDLVVARTNTGGAGGFARGIEHALDHHRPDLLWLMDDDTVPQPGALAELVRAYDTHSGDARGRRPALVASRVVWTDGRDHPMNTPRPKPGAGQRERLAAATIGCVPVRSASFVSVLCDAGAVRERGLPIADYFLWNDDFEWTTRLLRGRVGLACPSSVVEHRTAVFGDTVADPGARFQYEVRNKVWVFTRSAGLAPYEKALYGASTVRRWVRTIARSRDRPTLWRALRGGLVAGLRAGPRPNREVLGE